MECGPASRCPSKGGSSGTIMFTKRWLFPTQGKFPIGKQHINRIVRLLLKKIYTYLSKALECHSVFLFTDRKCDKVFHAWNGDQRLVFRCSRFNRKNAPRASNSAAHLLNRDVVIKPGAF